MVDLKTTLCGIELDNPVIPASGTFGFGQEFHEFYDINMQCSTPWTFLLFFALSYSKITFFYDIFTNFSQQKIVSVYIYIQKLIPLIKIKKQTINPEEVNCLFL